MRSPLRLTFLSIGLFLILFPLAVGRPGVPVTLKADEPAYYLMALSLAQDGDLLCDAHDIRRLVDRFPYLPIENLILLSNDGWKSVQFGKPYLYSLLATPAVWLADHRGMVALNMLFLLTMAWMGVVYLRRFNPEWLAGLFSLAFFLLGAGFSYAFWLQPEMLNMLSVACCLFLAFHEPQGVVGRRRSALGALLAHPVARAALSGGVLAVAVYHKPMLAILGVPALFAVLRRRGWRAAAAWVLAAIVAMAAIVGGSLLLTGQPIAYLGADRIGIRIEDPRDYESMVDSWREISAQIAASDQQEVANTYSWLLYLPEIHPRMLVENFTYFLVGRHTGLLVYFPFAGLAVLLFLLHGPRTAERWVTLAALAALGFYFVFWLHYNWHGGAGFVGNRYYVNALPAFLFLVTAIRPAWLVVPAFAVAGLFVAPLFFAPYGAPVPAATLQAHTRGAAYQWLPVEQSIRPQVPGYASLSAHGVQIRGRNDLVRTEDPPPGRFWVWGATTTDLWLASARPLESLLFQVASLAPDNEVTFRMGDRVERVRFEAAGTSGERRILEIGAGKPERLRSHYGKPELIYRLRVTTRTGRNPRHPSGQAIDPQFYVGADLTFLGPREELETAEHHRIGWNLVSAPRSRRAGEPFEVSVRVTNQSDLEWSPYDALPVSLSWRWQSADGQSLTVDGIPTSLPRALGPGEEMEARLSVLAPTEPGEHVLVVDALRPAVGWFSRHGGTPLEIPVRVRRADAEASQLDDEAPVESDVE
jgi:hypothetical protein